MRWKAHGLPLTVATALVVIALRSPAAAAPPEDVPAFCRANYPQMQFQIRCISLENAAQGRVARRAPTVDGEALGRCRGSAATWAEMETCLASAPRASAAAPAAAPGAAPGGGAAGESREPARAPGAGPAGAATAPVPSPPPLGAPGAVEPPPRPSTVILGPRPGVAAPAGEERNRPTRPISEADAERQLRSILEREGGTVSCTKKPYGPGWVIVCE